jgi:hypothetical protein
MSHQRHCLKSFSPKAVIKIGGTPYFAQSREISAVVTAISMFYLLDVLRLEAPWKQQHH